MVNPRKQIPGSLSIRDRALIHLCNKSFRFYKSVHVLVTLQTANGPIKLPLINGVGLRNLWFDHSTLNPSNKENWINWALHAAFRCRQGAFVDVGVNIGKVLINLVVFNPAIPYRGFEPNPNCLYYAVQLIRANDLRNHMIFPIGLSDYRKHATLLFQEDFDVSGSVIDGFHEMQCAQSCRVLLDTGDQYLRDEPVAVIKLDIEGSELAALRGLTQTIEKSQPILFIEILDWKHLGSPAAEIRRRAAEQIAEYLDEHDYVLYRVTSALDLEHVSLQSASTNLQRFESNYIAVPASLGGEFPRAYHDAADRRRQ